MARPPYHKQGPIRDNVFNRILEDGVSKGMLPGKTDEARDWFRKRALDVTSVDTKDLLSSDPRRYRQTIQLGRMYMFYYDPKLKQTLPYFDRLPLVFPIEAYHDGFLGINLHYLDPRNRAGLMDALYSLINNNKFDATTKLGSGHVGLYRIMKNVSRLKAFKPCVKRYLKTHVRSRFISVGANEWDTALFLPLERFEKASMRQVWSDSRNKIR